MMNQEHLSPSFINSVACDGEVFFMVLSSLEDAHVAPGLCR